MEIDDRLAPKNFSEDQAWMSDLVLIAKHVYVWLDQLSNKYGRKLTTINDIPDEELNEISKRGITGIWLIGVWERSQASKIIKRRMGNAQASASAYSIHDYVIAKDLGGDDALVALTEKSRRFNIRLGSDMVPNHMGIDSNWVVDHPEWFLNTDISPFPGYTFEGEYLAKNKQMGISL
ncbi:MAG: alpha-amylase family glycosyl hydrolase, partial [Chloroflexota bacterium]